MKQHHWLTNLMLLAIIYTCQGAIFPHKIWLYWNGDYDSMPEFNKQCVANIERTMRNTDWIIYKLND